MYGLTRAAFTEHNCKSRFEIKGFIVKINQFAVYC